MVSLFSRQFGVPLPHAIAVGRQFALQTFQRRQRGDLLSLICSIAAARSRRFAGAERPATRRSRLRSDLQIFHGWIARRQPIGRRTGADTLAMGLRQFAPDAAALGLQACNIGVRLFLLIQGFLDICRARPGRSFAVANRLRSSFSAFCAACKSVLSFLSRVSARCTSAPRRCFSSSRCPGVRL